MTFLRSPLVFLLVGGPLLAQSVLPPPSVAQSPGPLPGSNRGARAGAIPPDGKSSLATKPPRHRTPPRPAVDPLDALASSGEDAQEPGIQVADDAPTSTLKPQLRSARPTPAIDDLGPEDTAIAFGAAPVAELKALETVPLGSMDLVVPRIRGANPEAGQPLIHPLLYRIYHPGAAPLDPLLSPFQGLPVLDAANRSRPAWSPQQLRICASLEARPIRVRAFILAARWVSLASGRYLALALGASKRSPRSEAITALVPANALPDPLPSRLLARTQKLQFRCEIEGHLLYLSPDLPTGLARIGPWGITVASLLASDPWGSTHRIARQPEPTPAVIAPPSGQPGSAPSQPSNPSPE